MVRARSFCAVVMIEVVRFGAPLFLMVAQISPHAMLGYALRARARLQLDNPLPPPQGEARSGGGLGWGWAILLAR